MLLPDYQPGCVFHSVLYFILYFLKVKNRASLLPVLSKKALFPLFSMLYSGKREMLLAAGWDCSRRQKKDRISQKGKGLSMERISWKPEERRGLVAGNASISGDVSPRGRLFQRIVWNPPCFEDGRNGMREGGNPVSSSPQEERQKRTWSFPGLYWNGIIPVPGKGTGAVGTFCGGMRLRSAGPRGYGTYVSAVPAGFAVV